MALESQGYEYLIKVLIIGDSAVGKTCMLLRYCDERFSTNHLPTIGIDFKIKKLEVDNMKIKMQIWDTAGQERFKTITQNYYKGAHGIILAYACDDRESLLHIENWMKQTKTYAPEDVVKVLVGNKCDIAEKSVSYEEGKKVADEYGVPFYETSAKEGKNIYDTFYFMAKMIKEQLAEKEKTRAKMLGLKGSQLKLKNEGSKPSKVCC